jgi:hypothetical protein
MQVKLLDCVRLASSCHAHYPSMALVFTDRAFCFYKAPLHLIKQLPDDGRPNARQLLGAQQKAIVWLIMWELRFVLVILQRGAGANERWAAAP